MAAYLLALREGPVRDAEAMARYGAANRAAAGAFAQRFGIRPLAVYGALEALDGAAPDAAILLEFPDMATARAWYESPEYQAALVHRRQAADYRVLLMDGAVQVSA